MDSQLFRISEREANIGGTFHIVAYHVFYDLAQNLIEDTFVVNRNGNYAVTQILGAAQFPHPFTGDSDITTINSARLVRRNIIESFLNGELGNSFLSRWGGEILRDNFHVSMRRVRGSDNGVLIRDKKNLTGYRSNVDFGTVVTRIMPQGFDGLLLPEKYIDSPLIGNYLTPRIRVIKYDNVKAAVGQYADDEDAIPLPEAYALLRNLAAKEYSDNHIDKPTAIYEVEFAPLERTEEYINLSE
jgi:phage minor structural protein